MAILFDGHEIPAGADGDGGGAVFTLPEPAVVDAEYVAPGGERVAVWEHSRGVVVSGLATRNASDAGREGLVLAQRGLDVFSARGIADLYLSDPHFSHLAIYGEDGAQVLRVVGVETLNITIPPITAVVTDGEGNVRPQQAPVSVWQESMRYYRQAQLSEDVFDSFRSLWLAFENLLDSFEPQKPGEREKTWLKRGLGKADVAFGLGQFLPQPLTPSPVDLAYTYFYDEVRTHLFHAKASRNPLLPYDRTGANLLASRHEPLTRLYLRLLEEVTGVRRTSGAVTEAGFGLMMGAIEVDPMIGVTDDEAPADESQSSLNPAGGRILEARAGREESLEQSFLRVLVARWEADEAAALTVLRKAGLRSDGKLVTNMPIEGLLEISRIGALEMQLGLRLRNASLPKYFAEM